MVRSGDKFYISLARLSIWSGPFVGIRRALSEKLGWNADEPELRSTGLQCSAEIAAMF